MNTTNIVHDENKKKTSKTPTHASIYSQQYKHIFINKCLVNLKVNATNKQLFYLPLFVIFILTLLNAKCNGRFNTKKWGRIFYPWIKYVNQLLKTFSSNNLSNDQQYTRRHTFFFLYISDWIVLFLSHYQYHHHLLHLDFAINYL